MFTTFKNVKFVTADLAGFEVADSVLLIFTKNRTLELFFDSNEEALLAEQELEKLLIAQQYAQPETDTPSGSILDELTGLFKSTKANVFDGALSKAQDLFGKKPKAKAEFDFYGTLAAVLVQSASNNAQAKVTEIVKDLTASLEEVLDKVSTFNTDKDTQTPKPAEGKKTECTRPSPAAAATAAPEADRKVNIKRNDVFSARTPSSDVPTMPKECYMVIGDMTSPQLKAAIDNVLIALMSTEKCEQLFGSIRKQFGEEATQSAVDHFKQIVYTKCTENVDSTIAEVLTKHFL